MDWVQSGFANRYAVDVINMLQGVYIFIIFVLKRNVFYVVFNRKPGGRRSTVRSRSCKNEMSMTKRNPEKVESELMISNTPSTQSTKV